MCIQVEKVFANLYRLSCSNTTVRASREHLEQEQNTHPTFGVYLRPQDLVHTSRNIRYQLGTYLGSAAKPWTPQAPVSCISDQASPENKYLSKIWGTKCLLLKRASADEVLLLFRNLFLGTRSVQHSIWVVTGAAGGITYSRSWIWIVTVFGLNQTPKVCKVVHGGFTLYMNLSCCSFLVWIKSPILARLFNAHDGFTLRPECNLLDCFVLKRWRCPIRGRLKTWGNIQNKNMDWKAGKSLQNWRKKTENYKSPTCISWSQNKKRLSNLWGSGISWKLRWLNVFSFWDESTFPFFETTPRASTKR